MKRKRKEIREEKKRKFIIKSHWLIYTREHNTRQDLECETLYPRNALLGKEFEISLLSLSND